MSRHYNASELVDYERGLLDGEKAKQLFAHCQACQPCENRLTVVLALREIGKRRRGVRRRRLVATAAALVAMVLLGVAIYQVVPLDTDPQADGTVGIDAGTPLAEGSLAEYASTELPSRGFLVLRFRPGTPVANVDRGEARLKAAVEALWAGELDAALPALRELWLEQPNEERAAYMGIALYLTGQIDEEVGWFLEIGTRTWWTTLSRYSTYYLANHYLRIGQNDAAYELLESLTAFSDSPSRAAKRLLEQLPIRTRIP